MDWKETVITPEQAKEANEQAKTYWYSAANDDAKGNPVNTLADCETRFRLEKQAQITGDIAFAAGLQEGRQEVVDWADGWCTKHVCLGYVGGTSRLHKECLRCWQEQLKIWGLERKE